MTDFELTSHPTLCQRICCCFSSTSKEPPVKLIRSGTLPAASVPKTNGQHISAAEHTIDGFEDVNLEVRTPVDNTNPHILVEKESNTFNMNDIMMEEVFREEKPDDVECVIEDAISISTNVVEEVDESELSRLRLNPASETPPPEKKGLDHAGTSSQDESHDKVAEISRRLSLEFPSTSKADDSHSVGEVSNVSDKEDKTPTTNVASVTVTVESRTVETKREDSKSISDIVEKSSSDSENEESEVKQEREVGANSEEDIVVEITPTAPKAFEPPKSIMYADTSSDEDSDDEEDREVLPPVQRSHKIMNFDKIFDKPALNGNLGSGSTVGSNPLDEDSSSDEERNRKISDAKQSKEVTVTRIVVRDDGKPDELTSGSVKLSLDGREAITDEEFSEKLI